MSKSDLRIGRVIKFRGLVGRYRVADLSLAKSDSVVGAVDIEHPDRGTRYEPIKRITR